MAGGLQRRAGKAACGKDARKDRRGAGIIADRGRAPAVVGRRAALREVLRCLADQIRTRRRGSSKHGRVEPSIVEVPRRCPSEEDSSPASAGSRYQPINRTPPSTRAMQGVEARFIGRCQRLALPAGRSILRGGLSVNIGVDEPANQALVLRMLLCPLLLEELDALPAQGQGNFHTFLTKRQFGETGGNSGKQGTHHGFPEPGSHSRRPKLTPKLWSAPESPRGKNATRFL